MIRWFGSIFIKVIPTDAKVPLLYICIATVYICTWGIRDARRRTRSIGDFSGDQICRFCQCAWVLAYEILVLSACISTCSGNWRPEFRSLITQKSQEKKFWNWTNQFLDNLKCVLHISLLKNHFPIFIKLAKTLVWKFVNTLGASFWNQGIPGEALVHS